jgi:hypothetical protein
MESRKIISAGLLIIIIIISLIFSIWVKPISKEGLDVLKNPSNADLKKITEILNDSTKDSITKIKQIYVIAKDYTTLMAIYTHLSTDCFNDIIEYIKIAPIKDRDGKNIDENSISKENREKINGIMGSKSDTPEKVFAIRSYICNKSDKCDVKLSLIYNNYEKIWIDILNGYLNQLNSENGKKNKADAISYGKIN